MDLALTRMKIDADLHNFGQQVTQTERASEIYFQKPRPIFWEWFFFGKNSPLKDVFAQNFGSVLFSLEVHLENNDCGFSKKVTEIDTGIDQDAHAYNLGVLIAYCYLFGIRDLHKGNVIRREAHLQVIDAEVLFSKILLPNETLIMPFKIVTADDCAAKKVFDNIATISLDNLKLILSGYFDLMSDVLKNHDLLSSIFNNHREKMLKVPVRHIMRDTVQYRVWLENQIAPSIPFCNDELEQLKRGDIPYYFKFLGDPKLYSYKTVDGQYEAVSAPGEFLKGINRDATDPLELLSVSRIKNELLPTGSLFIFKKLLPNDFCGMIESHCFKAKVNQDGLQINFGEKTFHAKI